METQKDLNFDALYSEEWAEFAWPNCDLDIGREHKLRGNLKYTRKAKKKSELQER